MSIFLLLAAVIAGVFNPAQGAANAQLNKSLHAPAWAGVAVYATGLAGLLIVTLLLRQALPGRAAASSVPWWAWCGGVISLISTMAGLLLTQRLGSGTFTGASLTAAVVCSVVLDHFGWMGLRQHTASPLRVAGCGLLVAGIWLVAKF